MNLNPQMIRDIQVLSALEVGRQIKNMVNTVRSGRTPKPRAGFRVGPSSSRPRRLSDYKKTQYSQYTGKRIDVRRSKISALPAKVLRLQKKMRNNEGVLTYRNRSLNSLISSGVNTCTYAGYWGAWNALTELALAEMRFFNPAAPATFIQASIATGTNYKQSLVQYFTKFVACNNYAIPCKIRVYLVIPKKDTSLPPELAITNGFLDIGGISNTDPLSYPTDSILFKDLWKIEKSVSKVLQPGECIKMTHSSKNFEYDPSFVDAHGLIFQAKLGAHVYLVKLEGVVGHDTVITTEHATSQSGIDVRIDQTIKVTYDAGIDLVYHVNATDATGITNECIVSLVSNEQGFFAR